MAVAMAMTMTAHLATLGLLSGMVTLHRGSIFFAIAAVALHFLSSREEYVQKLATMTMALPDSMYDTTPPTARVDALLGGTIAAMITMSHRKCSIVDILMVVRGLDTNSRTAVS